MDELETDLVRAFRFGALIATAEHMGLDVQAIKNAYMDGGLATAMQEFGLQSTRQQLASGEFYSYSAGGPHGNK